MAYDCSFIVVRVQYLCMIRPQHDPSTEAISQINGRRAAAEADDVRKSSSQRHNQDLWDKERGEYIFVQRQAGQKLGLKKQY